uniref:Uncharacterized protein n=1 Tax=Tanacetum cinerariifolium TaxID=118510 RepID=A0A6L2MS14_TANCI|nr:hypothetical protein [Tanacetum cinerariifolium]
MWWRIFLQRKNHKFLLFAHPSPLQLNLKFQPSSESLFAYVVWIFLYFLVYSVVPCYLLSLRTEDIVFDPGICKSTFSKPDISHRYGTVKKFNTRQIEDDNLRKKLLNVNLLIAKIKALKDNSTPSSEFLTKSSSIFPKSILEETSNFDDSLPEFENFCFDLEEISSGSTTTHSDISLPDYEAFSFYDGHIEEITSGSTTTHSDISLPDYEAFSFYDGHIEEITSGSTTTHSDISHSEYDSFIFDLSNDQCPPTDRSDFTHEEFADELAHIISPPEYDCFYFRNSLDSGEWISSLNSGTRENLSSTTCVNLPVDDDHSPLLAYVVWIFLAYLTYLVIPPHLHLFRNEDTIFDQGITINLFYSFKPGLSHRCGNVKKFNTHRSHLNECPMMINGKNTPILDVPFFHSIPLDQP